ncbi:MAG: phospho-N-acetylmuramoyl-pentapeptide-transferase [Butyricicoccus pullicaecorum]|nr:phospho-N-acetylmuramoyl-pentapeptide-transferase [Butyricicoccus pullicaecorum]
MKTILLAAVIAFAVTAAIGMPVIHWLRKMKFGQKILEIGPKWHMNKQNIPTMGGFMFMLGITVSMLILGALTGQLAAGGHAVGNFFAVLLIALAYGLVGMVDDWAKIKKKQNAGLSAGQKMLLQIVVAAVFLSLLRLTGGLSAGLWIPGANVTLELSWVVYLIFSIVVVVGCDNAVNLTDGIDGLAASVTVPVAIFFAAVGYCQQNPGVMAFAGALAGALLGFLIFNFNPAKVFMGDTGSLFLGGAVAGLAFACDMPLMLLPVGFIYICETLSVILQVSYFKATHGKRLFKMAPVHHHFEMCGWGERKIVGVFTAITVVMCILAWMLFRASL